MTHSEFFINVNAIKVDFRGAIFLQRDKYKNCSQLAGNNSAEVNAFHLFRVSVLAARVRNLDETNAAA